MIKARYEYLAFILNEAVPNSTFRPECDKYETYFYHQLDGRHLFVRHSGVYVARRVGADIRN
ncbi:hypothetical protein TUM12370_09510 [Salmonella enterica subsp. enterica serovar Choleraesuis]|nr:hypothetical protein TUM12370_09510 [Salmonella enterica subsp. enterica serovar Choleraesuis]